MHIVFYQDTRRLHLVYVHALGTFRLYSDKPSHGIPSYSSMPACAIRFLADASSDGPISPIPYLPKAVSIMEAHAEFDNEGFGTHHVIAAMPRNALRQLNTSATMPRAVKPAGRGAGETLAPFKSNRSFVLPAALPDVGRRWSWQTCRWSRGITRLFCSSSGASIIVATRPEATCHSM